MMHVNKRIAVIGGGIAGLSCAYELAKRGLSVKLFEGENFVGGRMSSRMPDGLAFDTGAQILGSNYTAAHAYCQELGIAQAWGTAQCSRDYVYKNNALHALHWLKPTKAISLLSSLHMLLATMRLKWQSKGMDLLDLTAQREIHQHVNAYDYAVNMAGKEATDYIIDPIFYGNNFYSLQQLSIPAFLSAFKFGFLDVQSYCHLEEKGISLLPEKLAERINISLSSPITYLQRCGKHIEIATSGHTELFDIAILAVPAHTAKKIYINPHPETRQLLNETSYSATITISYLVPCEAIRHMYMGFVPAVESQIISSFVAQSTKGKYAIKNGKSLLNIFLRDPCARMLMGESDVAIFNYAKPACLQICPTLQKYSHQVENYDLQRWPAAIPLIPPGFISKVQNFWQTAQGQDGVYLCGDFLASPYVEGSIRCAQRVAATILNSIHMPHHETHL